MAWFNSSYLFKKLITIDFTKVSGGADLTSFPVLISFTDANLKVVGSGGSVQNSSGFDIIFTDSTETTKLDHEIEKYVSTTGEVEMWVRIPTLSHTANTLIYMYYDNASISTSQENKTGVWDSNFKGVYHLGNGSTLSVADSTANAANATNSGATAAAGQIDGGAQIAAAASFISLPTTGLPTGANSFSVSFWVNSSQVGDGHALCAFGANGSGTQVALYYAVSSGVLNLYTGSSNNSAGSTLSNGSGYQLAITYDGTTLKLYVNGTVVVSVTITLNISYGIAYIGNDFFAEAVQGIYDEVEYSNSVRAAGWIMTSVANQNTPSSFYSVGSALFNTVALSSTLAGSGVVGASLAMLILAADTFVRANQANWGQSSSVGTWAKWNGASTASIASNKGLLTGATDTTTEYIGTTSAADVDERVRFVQSAVTASCGLIARGVPASANYYAARLKNGSLTINVVAGGIFTPFATAAFSATAGSAYWIRYRLTGSTHMAKVWADGSVEPNAWQLTATDSTYSAAGPFGITAQQALTGDSVQFDSFTAYLAGWSTALPAPIYFGAYEPPFYPSTAGIATFEALIGTPISLFNAYSQWAWAGNTPATLFDTTWANTVRNHGAIPMLTWQPTDGSGVTNAAYSLANITAGNFDTYITTFANAVKAWGFPLFLRFAHEMNGNWYSWCEGVNGNAVGSYVPMWKHVHDIFTAQGVTNVTWVWCPNDEGGGAFPITGLYPGDAYVDWTGIDGYNASGGATFGQIYTPIYNDLVALTTRPILIAECGTVEEAAGVKGWWYYDMLRVQLPYFFPKIRAMAVFDAAYGTATTIPVNSTTDALNQFIAGIRSGYYIRSQPGSTQALSLYGSKAPASSPTSAGNSAMTTGGTEVAAVTTAPASGSGYVECFALGGVSTVNASLPAPSGKGWTLDSTLLEGNRLVAGNWTGSVAVSDANGGGPVNSYTLRFWQRSSGDAYAAIGSLVLSASQVISTLRVLKTFLAAAMPQTDFTVGDKLYIDFFINANGWASDVLSVYVSNSGTAGVAGDLEVDTAGYTPSGAAGVVTSYIPRALSAVLVVTSTALLDTLSGTGQLTGAISTLSTALSITFSGGGVLSGQVTANLALPTTTLAGASSLAGLQSLATSLATSQFAGSSTLAASILARTVLISQLAGIGTLASSFQLATSLTDQLAGVSTLSATIMANLALPVLSLAGGGTLSGTLSISTLTPVALAATMVGSATLTGTGQLATSLNLTLSGISTLSATIMASTTLASTTLPGSGALIGVTARGTALSTTTLIGVGALGSSLSVALTLSGTSWAGVGAFSGTLTGAGGLVGTLSGGSTLTGSLSAALTLIGTSFAGVGVLSATVQASTVLSATLVGGSTLSGVPGARTALGATLVGASTLTGATALATTLTGAFPAVGTLTGAAGRSTTLSVALPGSGQLIAVSGAQTSLASSFAGVGAAAFTVLLRTSLSITLSGAGNVTSASLSYRAALALLLAGLASLSGSLTVPVLAYLTATWKTRDGQVVWKTRDEQEATWKTRDGQVTWKIRS